MSAARLAFAAAALANGSAAAAASGKVPSACNDASAHNAMLISIGSASSRATRRASSAATRGGGACRNLAHAHNALAASCGLQRPAADAEPLSPAPSRPSEDNARMSGRAAVAAVAASKLATVEVDAEDDAFVGGGAETVVVVVVVVAAAARDARDQREVESPRGSMSRATAAARSASAAASRARWAASSGRRARWADLARDQSATDASRASAAAASFGVSARSASARSGSGEAGSLARAWRARTARLDAANWWPLTPGLRASLAGREARASSPPPLETWARTRRSSGRRDARSSRFRRFLLGVPSAPPSGPRFAAAAIADSPSDLPVAKAARTSAASRPRPAALSFARTSSMAFLLPLPTCVFCRLDASPASTRVFTATAARSFFRSARRHLSSSPPDIAM